MNVNKNQYYRGLIGQGLMPNAWWIVVLLLWVGCKPVYHLSDISQHNYRFDEKQLASDPEIEKLIEPYKIQLDDQMKMALNKVDQNLVKMKPQGTLNNWISDILLEYARANYGKEVDFAIQNYGGMRVLSISPGILTVGKVYELMPFENQLVIMKSRGVVVRKLFERIAQYGGWPVSKTITFVGSREGVIKKLEINGKEISDNEIYTFALPDYIANGGDKCPFLTKEKREDLNIGIREAIIQQSKWRNDNGVSENSKIDNRIRIVQ